MKAILHKLLFPVLLLILVAANASAATYDWVGTTMTGGVYDWNNKLNWQVGGVNATTVPGAADIVRIAVLAYTNDPTITDARSCASVTLGNYDNFTLTVNGSLTVSGNITQTNDPNFYQYTTLTGTGTITCNNFTLGDNTIPNAGIGVVNNVSCQVTQMTVNGNIVLNSTGNSTGDGIVYPFFSLDANQLTLSGQIITATYNNPLSGGVNDPTYPGLGLFQMDSYSSATTLELLNANPISLPITSGYTIDFTNNGTGAGTVIYGATSGTQAVYTTANTGIGINAYNYDYLTFAGASTKVPTAGPLTIGNDWTTGGTGTVNLSTYNPTITVTHDWINSTDITQGSGNITVSNTLQNNSNTITLGSGNLSISNILQINFGTVKAGAGMLTVNGVFQNNSGTLTCGSGSVTFKGTYSNSGTFTAGTGMVYFSGASQTLVDNSATGTTFNNVTFNGTGTATMGAGVGNFAVSASGLLILTSPAKLSAGSASTGYLTLKSNATGSATVTSLSGTSAISGYVNVQRYLTGGTAAYRGYRLLSSPVYVATVSSNNVYNFDYIKASMLLSGAAGGGFDKTGNPSLYMYRENQAFSTTAFTVGNFSEVTKINNSPTYNVYTDGGSTTYNPLAGNGFLVFFRGDRTTNAANKYTPGTVAESVTLTATGNVNQGQITVHDWYTPASVNLGYTVTAGNATVRGFNLVGNPYPSSINWDTYNTTTTTSGIYAANVGATVYILDPVTKNYGAYTQGSGGVGTHNTTNVIPQGQGFFVLANSAAAKLIFNESAKTTTQVSGPNLLMGKPIARSDVQYLHLQLTKDSINNDDILIRFVKNADSAFVENEDAEYKQGYGVENLSSYSSDNTALAINVMPLPKQDKVIKLFVNANSDGNYQLEMKGMVGIPELYNLLLHDKYTGTIMDMRKAPSYGFDIHKSDSTSFGNRFELIMKQDTAFIYRLIDFKAGRPSQSGSSNVQLTWTTVNEGSYTIFTVERSTDGKTFNVVGGFESTGAGKYSLVDRNAVNGPNYYRLAQTDINDSTFYSNTIIFMGSNTRTVDPSLDVYPNPTNGQINLLVSQEKSAGSSYKIRISNSQGLVVKEINSPQPSWTGNISGFLPGSYVIQVTNTKTNTLVGRTKFVKL